MARKKGACDNRDILVSSIAANLVGSGYDAGIGSALGDVVRPRTAKRRISEEAHLARLRVELERVAESLKRLLMKIHRLDRIHVNDNVDNWFRSQSRHRAYVLYKYGDIAHLPQCSASLFGLQIEQVLLFRSPPVPIRSAPSKQILGASRAKLVGVEGLS